MLLLDVSAVACRAYYATPDDAVGTFRRLLAKYRQIFQPRNGAAVACLDSPGPTFRHRIFWPYKWGRQPKPCGLSDLLSSLPDELQRAGWVVLRAPGYEADDIIATMSRRFGDVVIASSDKDLFQLIGSGPGRGAQQWDLATETMVDRDHVWRKFGVDIDNEPASMIVELQALIGDQVDNVPGCPGIGPKAADRLVRQYGSAMGAVEAAQAGALSQDIPQHRANRQRLIDGADSVRLSHTLVSLHHVPGLLEQAA